MPGVRRLTALFLENFMPDGDEPPFVTMSADYDYLAPDGSEIRLLAEGAGGGLAHCKLPTGGVSKPVAHKTVEEIWYCVSGRGEVWRRQGETERVVGVRGGTSLTIPRGASFQFRNTGEDPLCFIIATIPRWPGAEEAEPVQGRWGTE